MRMTKKVVSLVLAVMMISTMLVVGAVSASAATGIGTAQELYQACRNGGDYVLTQDITLDYNRWTFMGDQKVVTIDGKGHTISADEGIATDTFFDWYLTNTATLNLSNVTLDGKGIASCAVYTPAESLSGTDQNKNEGTIVNFTNVTVKNFKGFSYVGAVYLFSHATGNFTDCTFVNNASQDPTSPYEGSDIWAGGATTVNISGGSYGDSVYGNASGTTGSSVTIEDASVSEVALGATAAGGVADVTITNSTIGTVNNEAPQAGGDNSNITIDNDSAAVVQDFDGNVDDTLSNNVIMTKDDLEAAVAAGGNYVLGADMDYTGDYVYIPAGKTVVIDLAGHDITGGGYGFCNAGDLTINDSKGTGTVSGTYAVRAQANSTTTINGGNFQAQECAVATFKGTTNATITINDGTFTTVDNSVLSGNGTSNPASGNNTWNVNGGTFNGNITSAGYNAAGIYAPNNDTWNVNGGTFNITNGAGIVQRAGTVNVSDGVVIKTTGEATGKVGDSRVVVPCSAIVFDSAANYPMMTDAAAINITGGTFESEDNDGAIAFVQKEGDTNDRITVYGGEFSSDVDEFVADGLTTEASGGKFVIVVDDNPLTDTAQIEGKEDKVSDSAVRIVTKVDRNFLETQATEYGYVVAMVENKDQATANFGPLTAANGAKKINCTGTYNANIGKGDNYITLAVNGMSTGKQVAARFYAVIGGTTYYAKYLTYDGIIAEYES